MSISAPATDTDVASAPAGNTDYDPSAFRQVFEQHFTYASAVERNTHRYANRAAITDSTTGETWTYRQLGEVTGALVAGLAERGIGVGDIVGYQLMNRPEFAFLYVASQGLRAVSSPMNFRLAPAETAHILSESKPRIFVYEAAAAADVRTALGLTDFVPEVLAAVGDDAALAAATELVPGTIPFAELLVEGAPSFRAPEGGSVWTRPRASTPPAPPACPKPCR
ncbi:AMP-binding protein [Herbiconiux sp. UC225_62]|uniref:AMP-binding protein n=1 Tax=Herbiconiux sp. UC225_62 TaxID=3350168 RepID=UPI0036D2A80D